MHLTVKFDYPKRPSLFDNIKHWLKEAQLCSFEDKQSQAIIEEIDLDRLSTEIAELEPKIISLQSPVCFCHNDLLYGNVMYDADRGTISFIDYEYGGYNYRGYDIGNHFTEWCFDYRCNTPPCFNMRAARYPDSQQQRYFITCYIEESKKIIAEAKAANVILPGGDCFPEDFDEADDAETENEVQKIAKEANLFALSSQILWALWVFTEQKSRKHNSLSFIHSLFVFAFYNSFI